MASKYFAAAEFTSAAGANAALRAIKGNLPTLSSNTSVFKIGLNKKHCVVVLGEPPRPLLTEVINRAFQGSKPVIIPPEIRAALEARRDARQP